MQLTSKLLGLWKMINVRSIAVRILYWTLCFFSVLHRKQSCKVWNSCLIYIFVEVLILLILINKKIRSEILASEPERSKIYEQSPLVSYLSPSFQPKRWRSWSHPTLSLSISAFWVLRLKAVPATTQVLWLTSSLICSLVSRQALSVRMQYFVFQDIL